MASISSLTNYRPATKNILYGILLQTHWHTSTNPVVYFNLWSLLQNPLYFYENIMSGFITHRHAGAASNFILQYKIQEQQILCTSVNTRNFTSVTSANFQTFET